MNFLKAVYKFVPVVILAGLMIKGVDALSAAPIATFAAIFVACTADKLKFQECIDAGMNSVSKILVALFILMFAYAMASDENYDISELITLNSFAKLGVCSGRSVALPPQMIMTSILS